MHSEVNLKHTRRLLRSAWPAVWLWIFLAIIILGIGAPLNPLLTVIKVGGIFLCLWYTIRHSPQDHLLQAAFLATCIADIILALNNTAEIGIFVFLIAQILHNIRLRGRTCLLQAIAFIALASTVLITNLIWDYMPMIYGLCGFYIVTLLANIYASYQRYRHAPHSLPAKCALLGFVLFLCCDASTGLSYLSLVRIAPVQLYAIANYLAWFFYYPSQVLISNSSFFNYSRKSMVKC